MNYTLLWVTQLSFCLFLISYAVALFSRCKKASGRRLWPILVAILLFLPFPAINLIGGFIFLPNKQPEWLSWYGLLQAIAYIIGVVIILKRGLSGSGSGEQNALAWHRGQLVIAFILFLLLYLSTINRIETKVVSDLKRIKSNAAFNIVTLLPQQLSPASNSYPIYKTAMDALPDYKVFPKWFSKSYKPSFNLNFNEASKLLQAHQSTLNLIKDAVKIEDYSLELYQAIPYELNLPNFIKYRYAAILFAISARMKADSGELNGALNDLATMKLMANHLRNYPTLISFMVAVSIDEIRYVVLEYTLSQKINSISPLIKYPVTAHTSVINSYSKTLRLEAQNFLYNFSKRMENNDYSLLTTYFRIFILPNELSCAKELVADKMGIAYETFSSLENGMNSIAEDKNTGKLSAFTTDAVPNYLYYHRRAMRHDVMQGITDLAIAATGYQESTGQYPSSIDELIPTFIDKAPLDPYDNQPLRIIKIDKGLDIYSNGFGRKLENNKKDGPIHFYLGSDVYLDTQQIKTSEKY